MRSPRRFGIGPGARFTCILLLLARAGVAYAQQLSPPALPENITSRIDLLISDTMKRQHVPGVSVAIARDSKLVYSKGYGYRNLDNRLAANGNTKYAIESITKELTASGILLLQEKGKLNIEDPLSKFV